MELKDGWNNRILIVDDEESFHQSFEEMLNLHLGETPVDDLARDLGFDVEESFLPKFELLHARNGKEAYEKIEEAIKEDNPIAVAYIDIRMPPGWDGVETARRIREIDKNIEIVIMTAFSGKSLSEIIHDHGMESLHKMLYLEKQQDDVRGVIQQRTVSLVEKWNAERELNLNRQRLRAVLDSTKDAIAMFDKTGHLVFVNRMYKEMFGLSDDALAEMSADELRQQIKQCFQEPELFDEAEASFAENPYE